MSRPDSIDGSYVLDSFTENKESEVSRLKFQVELFYKKEFELYRKLGLKDGMKIIECGSGPGFLISNIVRDMPKCSATAVEIDPYLADELNKRSLAGGRRLFEVKQASIYDTEQPDSYYDFAIARLVLEHLKEPERAIAEIRRILKPGGCFVIISNDFAYHLLTDPSIPELDEMYMAYIESRFREGGNPLIGRQLPGLIKKGKFENISIEVICVHSVLEGDKAFLKAENVNISKSLVREGFLKREVLDSLIAKWYNMLQQEDHAIFRQLFVVSGTKSKKAPEKDDNSQGIEEAKSHTPSLTPESLEKMTPNQKESALGLFFSDRIRTIMEQQDLELDLNTKLNDIDIDSIAAAELSGIVKSEFNTVISISDVLQKYSINEIIRLIIKNPGSSVKEKRGKPVSESKVKWLEGEL
jgi:ubiquinone/menaquinone biosynthesis C-methylase UbiE/acyl carrier protein